jgi:LmbE family N-acetylglucosaminyl deacetylase
MEERLGIPKLKHNLIYQRKKNSLLASKILGFKWLLDCCGYYPKNAMDKIKLLDVIKIIEKAKKKIMPHIICTHNPHDLNVVHRVVAEATLTAFSPQTKEVWKKFLDTNYNGKSILLCKNNACF